MEKLKGSRVSAAFIAAVLAFSMAASSIVFVSTAEAREVSALQDYALYGLESDDAESENDGVAFALEHGRYVRETAPIVDFRPDVSMYYADAVAMKTAGVFLALIAVTGILLALTGLRLGRG